MRRLSLAPLALLLASSAAAQDTPDPIRAWYGGSTGLTTNFDGLGIATDGRVTLEKLGAASGTVLIGLQGVASAGAMLYGAVLGGASFDLADGVFANVSVGAGYGESAGVSCDYDTYECTETGRRGLLVPIRAEVHVASSATRSFGVALGAMPISPIGGTVTLGVHYNFGRNLRGVR